MIYLDTNAFYFFFFDEPKFSSSIRKIFEDVQKGREKGLTSSLTLDELAYIVLMRLIAKTYNVHPSDKLREKPEAVFEFLPKIKGIFGVILSFENLEIVPASKNTVAVIPQLMEKLLLPRDCIHYQTMRDYGCRKILSTDTDFDKLEDVERIRPEEYGQK